MNYFFLSLSTTTSYDLVTIIWNMIKQRSPRHVIHSPVHWMTKLPCPNLSFSQIDHPLYNRHSIDIKRKSNTSRKLHSCSNFEAMVSIACQQNVTELNSPDGYGKLFSVFPTNVLNYNNLQTSPKWLLPICKTDRRLKGRLHMPAMNLCSH